MSEGDAVKLKDGDVILFGTESKVSVEVRMGFRHSQIFEVLLRQYAPADLACGF